MIHKMVINLLTNCSGSAPSNAACIAGICSSVWKRCLAAATAGAGARAFITDGNIAASTNFAAQVTGGGSNNVPVYSDGTNWRIG